MTSFPEALRPSTVAAKTFTVSASVVPVLTANSVAINAAQFVLVEVQVAGVSVRFDSVDPTASVGHLYASGSREVWSVQRWNMARFIRSSGSDATVFATPLTW
jgi:hypothetical protein